MNLDSILSRKLLTSPWSIATLAIMSLGMVSWGVSISGSAKNLLSTSSKLTISEQGVATKPQLFSSNKLTSMLGVPNEIPTEGSISKKYFCPLTLSTDSTDITCNGNGNDQIILTVSGGSGDYGYSWSNGQTGKDIFGLSGGTYTVTVTDNLGVCTAIVESNVNEPGVLNLVVTPKDYNGYQVTCFGELDGEIYTTVTGGTGPYSYLWSNAETNDTISGLGVNYYSVTITDANGCMTNGGTNLLQPSPLGGGTVITQTYGSYHV